MAGKKGMRQYPPMIKAKIVERYKAGESIRALSREFGISRFAIQSWCGLTAKPMQAKRRGRPRKYTITYQREMELEIKQLKMEVNLLRSFLQAAGRW